MKFITFGIALWASVFVSRYELAFEQEPHHTAFFADGCEYLYDDPERPVEALQIISCAMSENIPFDSVGCFFSAMKFKSKFLTPGNEYVRMVKRVDDLDI